MNNRQAITEIDDFIFYSKKNEKSQQPKANQPNRQYDKNFLFLYPMYPTIYNFISIYPICLCTCI